MNIKNLLASLLLLAIPAAAQTTFTSYGLPGTLGEYFRAYYSTDNPNAGSMLGLGKGAQHWDFSTGQQSYESVLRTDIVDPNDANDAGTFPDATYAERDTMEPNNEIAWRYYTLTNQGRCYYGFDYPPNADAPPTAVFSPPTMDIPATVQFGQAWSRALNWPGVYLEFIPVMTYFTANATVDAYGTLKLPFIGTVPAVRVHEVHAYESDWVGNGAVDIHTNQYYYWLAPGVGVAAQVFLYGDNVLNPGFLAQTNEVLRVFAVNYYPNGLGPVAHLSLSTRGTNALLKWQWMTNATGYRVDCTPTLENPNWQTVGQPATDSWTNAISGNRQFYRVYGLP